MKALYYNLLHIVFFIKDVFKFDLLVIAFSIIEFSILLVIIWAFLYKTTWRWYVLVCNMIFLLITCGILLIILFLYSSFQSERNYIETHPEDIAINLEFYLNDPPKYKLNAHHNIIHGGKESVEVLLKCLIDNKNQECFHLLSQTISTATQESKEISKILLTETDLSEEVREKLKQEEKKQDQVYNYFKKLADTGSTIEKFYSVYFLKKYFHENIDLEYIGSLYEQIKNSVIVPNELDLSIIDG